MGKADDVLIGKGFRLERRGRHIIFDTNRTEAEHQEIVKTLAEMRIPLEERIKEKAEALRSTLRRFNSYDVIANMSLVNLSYNPETYKEYAHEGLVT
ncbi:hypothetical protein ACFLXV_01680 [Chloroflexota bacterium]